MAAAFLWSGRNMGDSEEGRIIIREIYRTGSYRDDLPRYLGMTLYGVVVELVEWCVVHGVEFLSCNSWKYIVVSRIINNNE